MMRSSRKPAELVRSGVRGRTVGYCEGRQGRLQLLQANFFPIGACANGPVNTPLVTHLCFGCLKAILVMSNFDEG